MKVLVLLPTGIDDEPYQEVNIIAGYESAGGVWNGTVETIEDVTTNEIEDYIDYAIINNFNMIIRPAGITSDTIIYKLDHAFYTNDIMTVLPAGTNLFQNEIFTGNQRSILLTGAGEVINQTGYRVDLFDNDLQGYNTAIQNITKTGTVYNISQIKRVSSSELYVKLSGVTDLTTIGILDHGTPITIAGLTGTDISTLPSGAKYTGNVLVESNAAFSLSVTTSAGTIGNYQNVTGGTVTIGHNGSGRVIVKTEDYGFWFATWGTYIGGVTGFSNTINGGYAITQFINPHGWGDSFEIVCDPGTGSYVGSGGNARLDTSSNANPYIAGKLAYVKDTLGCSWYSAVQRLKNTASLAGNYTEVNGYGKPDVTAAIQLGEYTLADNPARTLDTPEITVSRSGNTLTFEIENVDLAFKIELYRKNELVETWEAPFSTFTYTMPARTSRVDANIYKVKAIRGRYESEFSNTVEPYYYYYGKLFVAA